MDTLTKSELIDALLPYDDDTIVVACCTYGDRARTMQAVMLGDLTAGFLKDSAYSDSGFAVVEEGDEDDEDDAVHFFEPGDASEPMTKADLISNLNGLDDDDIVVAAWDYGDRSHTQQAIGFDEINEVYLNRSGYSTSGLAVVEQGDEDDDAIAAVVLNYNAL